MTPFLIEFAPTLSFGRFSKIPLGLLMVATFTLHLMHSNEVPIAIGRDLFRKTAYLLATSSSTLLMHSLAGKGRPQMHVSMRPQWTMTFAYLQGNTSLQMQASLCGLNYLFCTAMCATTLQNGAVQV